uniref:Uncharacterized protein n=1 Tax=Lepeophtheirus salmonis TaxID=72036 RepID=A0A0K2UTI6_LEPSM
MVLPLRSFHREKLLFLEDNKILQGFPRRKRWIDDSNRLL